MWVTVIRIVIIVLGATAEVVNEVGKANKKR